jgi:biotin---protein ligase
MNVLVYNNNSQSPTTLSPLRSILSHNYSVQEIERDALLSQPWEVGCALLVVMGDGDGDGDGDGEERVDAYLRGGGKVVVFGTAANSGTEIPFFNKDTPQDASTHTTSIQLSDGTTIPNVPHNPAIDFIGLHESTDISILARFVDTEGELEGTPAVVKFNVGKGVVVLCAPSSLSSSSDHSTALRRTLLSLGLSISPHNIQPITRPLPQFLVSSPSKPWVVSHILDSLFPVPIPSGERVFEDAADSFRFRELEDRADAEREGREGERHVIVCRDGVLPQREETPRFDLREYFRWLGVARKERLVGGGDDGSGGDGNRGGGGGDEPQDGEGGGAESEDVHDGTWGMGEALLYGEAVTSTQSLLDK